MASPKKLVRVEDEQVFQFSPQRTREQLLLHKLCTLSETVYLESTAAKKGVVAIELLRLIDLPDAAWIQTMGIPLRAVLPSLQEFERGME